MAAEGAPTKCLDTCLLAARDDLMDYGIVLSRNCRGPRAVSGDIVSRVEIRRGGIAKVVGNKLITVTDEAGNDRVVEFVEPLQPAEKEIVCRNTGASISIDEALIRGKE
jgi:hypothetical protein